MKSHDKDQGGFITMIVMLVLLIAFFIFLAYLRVSKAN